MIFYSVITTLLCLVYILFSPFIIKSFLEKNNYSLSKIWLDIYYQFCFWILITSIIFTVTCIIISYIESLLNLNIFILENNIFIHYFMLLLQLTSCSLVHFNNYFDKYIPKIKNTFSFDIDLLIEKSVYNGTNIILCIDNEELLDIEEIEILTQVQLNQFIVYCQIKRRTAIVSDYNIAIRVVKAQRIFI